MWQNAIFYTEQQIDIYTEKKAGTLPFIFHHSTTETSSLPVSSVMSAFIVKIQ